MTAARASADTARHKGGCLCRQVCYAFDGNPLAVAICHCRHCQRQSGSAFSVVCAVSDDAYTQTRSTRVFKEGGESGQAVQRHFYGNCDPPIVSIAAAIPGLTLIEAGSLDHPGRWTPGLETYCDASLPWLPGLTSERHARSNGGG